MPIHITDPMPLITLGERHVACAILADISSSMSGKPMEELNQGLREFGDAMQMDSLACGRTDVTVISFNSSVHTEMGFRPASQYEAPTLSASGCTAFNEAIIAALDALEARKAEYKANGVSYYRPWIFALSDGAPTDSHLEAAAKKRLQDAIRNKKVVYMPMGIGTNADIAKLQSYYPDEATVRPVLKADANNFKEAFVWLSASLGVVSHSDPSNGSEIQTPPAPSTITIGI